MRQISGHGRASGRWLWRIRLAVEALLVVAAWTRWTCGGTRRIAGGRGMTCSGGTRCRRRDIVSVTHRLELEAVGRDAEDRKSGTSILGASNGVGFL